MSDVQINVLANWFAEVHRIDDKNICILEDMDIIYKTALHDGNTRAEAYIQVIEYLLNECE